MNASEYKTYHESFMINNHGTSAIHTFFCILLPILSSLIAIITREKNTKSRYIIEYLYIIVPIIFGETILANYIYHINSVLIVVYIILLIRLCQKINLKIVFYGANVFKSNKITTITLLRGLTYLLTVFCILAVDFRIFPRYLAKTEKFGFSLMDVGVGLFVLMSGLVHKDIKNNIMNVFTSNFKLFSILIMLGISRYFATKQLNYQVHVTEYGVHWNFFYTLALTKILSSLILYFVHSKGVLFISLLIGVIHEYILAFHLQEWTFSDEPRNTFLNANREGISSCLGYLSLYLFAVYLKSKLLDNTVSRISIIQRLISMNILFWTVTYYVNIYRPISRVLANLCYCFFSESIFLSIILILYTFEILLQNTEKHNNQLLIITAINNNGLLYFLFANIMTGLVNITVRTLFVNDYLTILILHVYMTTSIYFVIFLQRRGIKI